MARKSVYSKAKVNMIVECLENGDSIDQAMRSCKVSRVTFYNWMRVHPEFADAVRDAQEHYANWEHYTLSADAKLSLKRLICGYEYDESKTTYERDPVNPSAPRIKGRVVTHRTVPPNAAAVIFALCNLDPEHWKNRVAQQVSAEVDMTGDTVRSLSRIPDAVLSQVIKSLGGETPDDAPQLDAPDVEPVKIAVPRSAEEQ